MQRRPDPEPFATNDVAIVAGGTALFAVALLVLLALMAVGKDIHSWWWQMCLAGIALGLLGVRHCRRRGSAPSR